MRYASLASILLGIAVVAFFLWPVFAPLGPKESPAAKRGPAIPVKELHAAKPTDQTHVITDPAAPKSAPLAPDEAKPERLAALQGRDKIIEVVSPRPVTKLYYRVKVRDGGTLEAGDVVIKLDGITAREADAQCRDSKGKTWPCGTAAKAALTRLIRARAVACELPKGSEQKSLTARCSVGGTDLSAWMVRQGWGKPKQSPKPTAAER